jgi:hypothetical protein
MTFNPQDEIFNIACVDGLGLDKKAAIRLGDVVNVVSDENNKSLTHVDTWNEKNGDRTHTVRVDLNTLAPGADLHNVSELESTKPAEFFGKRAELTTEEKLLMAAAADGKIHWIRRPPAPQHAPVTTLEA